MYNTDNLLQVFASHHYLRVGTLCVTGYAVVIVVVFFFPLTSLLCAFVMLSFVREVMLYYSLLGVRRIF